MGERITVTLIKTLEQRDLTLRQLEEVIYTEEGDLLIEKFSVGSALSDTFGDSDLEDDTRIPASEVPKVLMALIGERFRDAWAFKNWLY